MIDTRLTCDWVVHMWEVGLREKKPSGIDYCALTRRRGTSSPAYALGLGRGRGRKRQRWHVAGQGSKGVGGGPLCALGEAAVPGRARRHRDLAFGYSLLTIPFVVGPWLLLRNCDGQRPPRYSLGAGVSECCKPLLVRLPCVVAHLPLCSALERHALSDEHRLSNGGVGEAHGNRGAGTPHQMSANECDMPTSY